MVMLPCAEFSAMPCATAVADVVTAVPMAKKVQIVIAHATYRANLWCLKKVITTSRSTNLKNEISAHLR